MYKNTAIDGAIVFMVGGINVDGLTVSVVKRMQCKILLGIVDRINCKKTLWYWLKSKCTLIILLIKWHVMVEIKKKKRGYLLVVIIVFYVSWIVYIVRIYCSIG